MFKYMLHNMPLPQNLPLPVCGISGALLIYFFYSLIRSLYVTIWEKYLHWPLIGKVVWFTGLISPLRELKLQSLTAATERHCLQRVFIAPVGLPLIQCMGKLSGVVLDPPGGNFHIKVTGGIFVGAPKRYQKLAWWVWLEFIFTPKRYQFWGGGVAEWFRSLVL